MIEVEPQEEIVTKKIPTLDEREVLVLKQILDGSSYDQIAKTIFRCPSLARNVAYIMFKKFNVKSRSMILEIAAKRGIVFLDKNKNKVRIKLRCIERILSDATKENIDQGNIVPSEQTEGVV